MGDGTSQPIEKKIQAHQFLELPQLRGNFSAYTIIEHFSAPHTEATGRELRKYNIKMVVNKLIYVHDIYIYLK